MNVVKVFLFNRFSILNAQRFVIPRWYLMKGFYSLINVIIVGIEMNRRERLNEDQCHFFGFSPMALGDEGIVEYISW